MLLFVSFIHIFIFKLLYYRVKFVISTIKWFGWKNNEVVKCCFLYLLFIFLFLNSYIIELNLLLAQSNGLDGRITRSNCSQPTQGDTMAPNLDTVEVLLGDD
jgi:hypothetical protein